jgi:hypothetical protein
MYCLPPSPRARVLALALALTSCGSPTEPSDPMPSLAILSPADVVRVGASVDMTLHADFADGRSTIITPVWSTDRPDIVTVKPLSASRQGAPPEDGKTGVVDHMLVARVTGLAPGDAMVVAESRYGRCARPIRVMEE